MNSLKNIKLLLIVFLMTIVSYSFTPTYAYNPEAIELYNSAVDLSKNGNFHEAINQFKKSILIDPEFTDAYYNLASIYEYLGNDSQAIANFEIILKKNPNDAEVAYKVAFLYYKKKDYNKTLSYLHFISPDNPKYTEAQLLSKKASQELNRQKQAQLAKKSEPKPITQTDIESSKYTYKELQGPTGIAKDIKGNLYIANYTANNIIQVSPDGKRKVYAQGELINGPVGMVVDNLGNIYVANYISNEVVKITPEGKSNVILKGVNKPYYLYLDKFGMLYISEQGSNTVIRIKVI